MPSTAAPFRHELLLHSGDEGYMLEALPFVREGLAHEEPVLVATCARRIRMLREALGPEGDAAHYEDITVAARNPARMIPAVRSFLDGRQAGAPARGIGDPVWPGRSEDELVECHLHESLVNVAFAEERGVQLVCPYDTEALDERVVHEARCSHPLIQEDGELHASRRYRGDEACATPFDAPLPAPPAYREVLSFDEDSLAEVRALTVRSARAAGLPAERTEDFVLAVNEIASNSVRYAGGIGVLLAWDEPGEAVCEIRDQGHIRDPLAGRRVPDPAGFGGWGLWIANQMCDLVQLRSGRGGTVVRAHMAAEAPVPADL